MSPQNQQGFWIVSPENNPTVIRVIIVKSQGYAWGVDVGAKESTEPLYFVLFVLWIALAY